MSKKCVSKEELKNILKQFLEDYGITENFDIVEIKDLRFTHYNVEDDVNEFVEKYFKKDRICEVIVSYCGQCPNYYYYNDEEWICKKTFEHLENREEFGKECPLKEVE